MTPCPVSRVLRIAELARYFNCCSGLKFERGGVRFPPSVADETLLDRVGLRQNKQAIFTWIVFADMLGLNLDDLSSAAFVGGSGFG